MIEELRISVMPSVNYLQRLFDIPLFTQRHLLFMLFVVFALCRLQIKPRVRKRFNVWQQRLNKRMKLFLCPARYTIISK